MKILGVVAIIPALLGALPSEAGESRVVPPPSLRDTDFTSSLSSFLGFATAPGITNANYSITWPPDQPTADLDKSALELEFDFDLPGRPYKVFTALSVSSIGLNDRVNAQNQAGEPVLIDPERDLLSARLSGGITLQVAPRLRATPYLSVILSNLESRSAVSGNADLRDIDPALQGYVLDFETKAATLAGSLELRYDHWFGERRVELIAIYTYSYTDTFDEQFDFLKSSGGLNVLDLEARWTAPTGLRVRGVPLRWKVFGGYDDFLDLPKNALGFTHFFEFGGGFDLEVNYKAFGLFGLRNIGLEASGIVGDDVTGWTVGLVVRN